MNALATTDSVPANAAGAAALPLDGAEAEGRRLLERIAAGDQRALEQFYRQHHGAVHQFALRLVKNAADAAELVNEAMLEVWRGAGRFRGESRVRTWLLGIVNYRAIDLMRKRKPLAEDLGVAEDVVDEGACDIHEALAGAENAVHVRTCVERLPDKQRQVVHLTFFEHLAYPEVAAVLEVPTGTVKTRMMHAKERLLRCLAKLVGSVEHLR
jgi:RNA polymerase sigma-70 factor, ECF subfamily